MGKYSNYFSLFVIVFLLWFVTVDGRKLDEETDNLDGREHGYGSPVAAQGSVESSWTISTGRHGKESADKGEGVVGGGGGDDLCFTVQSATICGRGRPIVTILMILVIIVTVASILCCICPLRRKNPPRPSPVNIIAQVIVCNHS